MTTKCLEFMKELYAVVDDPSTDSIISWGPNGDSLIVWNPAECCRDLLPRVFRINNFEKFERYGFKKVVESKPLEFACDDFVKGQPGRLEKIGQRYKEKLNDCYAKSVELLTNVVKNCKTTRDKELAIKEYNEAVERKTKAEIHQGIAKDFENLMNSAEMERKRRGQALSKDVEDKLKRVADEFNDLANDL